VYTAMLRQPHWSHHFHKNLGHHSQAHHPSRMSSSSARDHISSRQPLGRAELNAFANSLRVGERIIVEWYASPLDDTAVAPGDDSLVTWEGEVHAVEPPPENSELSLPRVTIRYYRGPYIDDDGGFNVFPPDIQNGIAVMVTSARRAPRMVSLQSAIANALKRPRTEDAARQAPTPQVSTAPVPQATRDLVPQAARDPVPQASLEPALFRAMEYAAELGASGGRPLNKRKLLGSFGIPVEGLQNFETFYIVLWTTHKVVADNNLRFGAGAAHWRARFFEAMHFFPRFSGMPAAKKCELLEEVEITCVFLQMMDAVELTRDVLMGATHHGARPLSLIVCQTYEQERAFIAAARSAASGYGVLDFSVLAATYGQKK
jgi:hypothetical protein